MTDEAVDVVDKWIVTKKKTGYPIMIDRGGLEQMLNVPHFPYAGVIDPDGNLIYSGDSAEAALKTAMKDAKGGSIWPKKLTGAVTQLRNGSLVTAWSELQALKTAGGLDAEEQKDVDRLSAYVTEATAASVTAARDLFGKNMVYAAVGKSESIANAKPALPASEDAQKLVAEMKALPTFELEMKGGELCAAAHAKEDAEDYLGAVNGYKDAAKKAEGAKIAAVAMARAQELVKSGMPGYAPACEKCQKAKKACEKHAKTVKL